MFPLLGKPTLFPDRFQLGGPTNVRLFRANSMGPRDGGEHFPVSSLHGADMVAVDSLGGDMYWAAGMSVISDIPKKSHWPIKAHMFVNAGRLDTRDTSTCKSQDCGFFAERSPDKSLAENVTSIVSQPSASIGLGLVYKFDWIRVEGNFGVPLAAAASDGARKGFQVGMGVEFL
jgi:outer membrane protein insertion porin family